MNGDIRASAKLMREIEDNAPSARETIRQLYPHTGRAHIVGITGPPGTGKSTLADRLVGVMRQNNRTVGVVAVDPSSPFTGGAILGDRIRMQRHSEDPGVFIRSLASKGHIGGLSRCAWDIVTVMDAMGKDVIIIETVGAGQAEIEIIRLAHTIVVVSVPGFGDGMQTIKAGILEIGHIHVVNKSDLAGAAQVASGLKQMLEMNARMETSWKPPVLETAPLFDRGIESLSAEIDRHREHMDETAWKAHRKKMIRESFFNILRDACYRKVTTCLENSGQLDIMLEDMMRYRYDPYTVAETIMGKATIGSKNDERVSQTKVRKGTSAE